MKKTPFNFTENPMKKYLPTIFCIYTLCVPFLIGALFVINQFYGVSCGDGCNEVSRPVFYTTLCLFAIVGLLNIVLYIAAHQELINRKSCLAMVILNCLGCVHALFLSLAIMTMIFLGIPLVIIIALQTFFGLKILLKELLVGCPCVVFLGKFFIWTIFICVFLMFSYKFFQFLREI